MTEHRTAPQLESLARRTTGADGTLLVDAMGALDETLHEQIAGRRLLLVGAAGFIAGQTLRVLLPYQPAYVGLVDVSENGLAELVRDLRSGGSVPRGTVVEPWLVDVTQPTMGALVRQQADLDLVMNFAAVKHVRSEREALSLVRMLQVNLLATHRLAELARRHHPGCRHFVVSTDKAADPASFMGASKRAMEVAAVSADPRTTSARFANVAFSAGSLPESWLRRLAAGQPLAVPDDTWRYFVTPGESGQLCALAALAPPGTTVVPDIGDHRLVELFAMLVALLHDFGLEPHVIDSDDEGRELLARDLAAGRYPVVVTPRDTSGEKRAETFVGQDDSLQDWLPGLHLLRTEPAPAAVDELLAAIGTAVRDPGSVGVADLEAALSGVVPEFRHVVGAARLDDRI